MEQPGPARSTMAGLWAFTVGGLAMAMLMFQLELAYHWSDFLGMPEEQCANYYGNGNAGPFAYTTWEYLLPFLAFVWVMSVAVEQGLASARANRGGHGQVVRGALALVGSIVLSCWLPCGLAVTCG
ncbi:hypothetical protein [Virgisporangium aurantiacum]|uniref:Uncharacterized protein n=1 Tax=Virgisporangium aurantiacum TaxID=175570 RepID=A0A8J3ZE90_9ACTN|nr:hypothetical protein [Virgisporangium aurantiacum]GIJ62354.1 hypothetical protein Vau01_098700 [Virgisporangium aurantiacum]